MEKIQTLADITRVHGRESTPLSISVNGKPVASRVQPAISGRWVEIVTLIPGDQITGAPAVSDGVAYVGSWDGCLYAVDPQTGREKWKFETGGQITGISLDGWFRSSY